MHQERLSKPVGFGLTIVASGLLALVMAPALAAEGPSERAVSSRPSVGPTATTRPAIPGRPSIGSVSVSRPAVGMRPPPVVSPSTTKPADTPKLTIALVKTQVVLQGYSGFVELQTQLAELRRDAGAARQGGDQSKIVEYQQKFDQLRLSTTKYLRDAIEFVAKREHCDVIVGDIIYKADDAEVVDLTGDVIEHLNSTATTLPSSGAPPAPSGSNQPKLSTTTKPAAAAARQPGQ